MGVDGLSVGNRGTGGMFRYHVDDELARIL